MDAHATHRGFGDAGGFGDVEDALYASFVPRPVRAVARARRNASGPPGVFGDAEAFGDAGGFDYAMREPRRPALRAREDARQ